MNEHIIKPGDLLKKNLRRTPLQPDKVALRVFRTEFDEKTRNLIVYGKGLRRATFTINGSELDPVEVYSDKVLLSGEGIRAAIGSPLVIWDRRRSKVMVDLPGSFHPAGKWFRFSKPENRWFSPTGTGQPMLVLQVVFHDVTPDWTGADGATHLGTLLNGPGLCANDFWNKVSYGKTSFRFDIDPNIITLPGNLDNYLIPIPNSSMFWFNNNQVIEDALAARVENMSDADAENFLRSYEGVLLSHAVNKDEGNTTGKEGAYWPHADSYEIFTVRGVQYAFGYICSTHAWGQENYFGPWLTNTHELGHVLGLPDLYPSSSVPDIFEGQEVMQLDIMCNGHGDGNPTVWEKAYRSTVPTDPGAGPGEPWMGQDEIVPLNAPGPGQTNIAEALLVPSSIRLPPANPFETSYPGIALAHAISFHLDPNRHILVEARQVGPVAASPPFGDAAYDRSIFCDGVFITEAVNNLDLFPATRRNVTLLSPDFTNGIPSFEEITIGGGTITAWEDTAKRMKVELLSIVQNNPKIFHIRASWGPGPAPNLYITPWSPPPWESPDIWADDEANGWDVYIHSDASLNPSVPGNPVGSGDSLAVGSRCRLSARVHNTGDADAQNVKVNFAIVAPQGSGLPIPIGSAIIPAIPAGHAGIATVEWVPDSSNGGHVCIQASAAVQPGEIISVDNVAQENLTDWYIKSSSPYMPVEFPFQIHNSLPEGRLFAVEVLGLRLGYHVDVNPRQCWLEPGETRIGRARIVVDKNVPLENRERRAPVLHLQFKVLAGCYFERIGGISGWAHCVRKVSSKISVVPIGREGERKPGAKVNASYVTSAGPVAGAQVAVRLEDPKGKTVTVERGITDKSGQVKIWIPAPSGFLPKDEYRAVVMLQPMIGIGPEETAQTFYFTN